MKRLLLLITSLLSIQLQALAPYRNNQPTQNVTFVELKKAAPVALDTQAVAIQSDALCDFDGDLTINDAITISSEHALSVTSSSNVSVSGGLVGVVSSSVVTNFPIDPNLSIKSNSTHVTNKAVIYSANVIITGSLDIQGHLVIKGNVSISGAIANYINIAAGGTLEVQGNITCDGVRAYNVVNNGTLTVLGSLSFIYNTGATDGILNTGTMQASSTITFDRNVGTTGYGVNNTGTVTGSAIFACSNSGILGGINGISDITNTKGDITITDTVTITSTNDISKTTEGTAVVYDNASVCISAYGSITNFTDTKNVALSPNFGDEVVVIDANRVTINGKLIIDGELIITGDLYVNGKLTDYINISATGLLDVHGNIYFNGDSQYNFINAGNIRSNNQIFLLNNHSVTDYGVKNTGTMVALEINACGNTGTPSGVGGGGTFNGSSTVTNIKGTLTINDTLTIDVDNNVAGTGSGSASLSASGHACLNSSGTITNVPTLTNFDQLAMTGTGQVVFDADTLILNGKLDITGGNVIMNGNLQINGSASNYLNIASGATLEVRGNITCDGMNSYNIINNGTITGFGTLVMSNNSLAGGNAVSNSGSITISSHITMDDNAGHVGVFLGGTVESTSGDLSMNNNVGSGSLSRGVATSVASVISAESMLFNANSGQSAIINPGKLTATAGDITFINNIGTTSVAILNTNEFTASGAIVITGNSAANSAFVNSSTATVTASGKVTISENDTSAATSAVNNQGTIKSISSSVEFDDNGSSTVGVENGGTVEASTTVTYSNHTGGTIGINHSSGTTTAGGNVIFDTNSGSTDGFVDNASSTITANSGSGTIYFCSTTHTSDTGTFNGTKVDGCPP